MADNNWLEEFEDEQMNASKNVRKHKALSGYSWDRRYLKYLPWIFVFLILVVFLFSADKKEENQESNSSLVELRTRVAELERNINDLQARLSNIKRQVEQTLNGDQNKGQGDLNRIEDLGQELRAFKKSTKQEIQGLKKSLKDAKDTAQKVTTQKGSRHTVQKGDTLYSLAQKNKVSVEELRKWNNLEKGDSIYPGQKLVVQP